MSGYTCRSTCDFSNKCISTGRSAEGISEGICCNRFPLAPCAYCIGVVISDQTHTPRDGGVRSDTLNIKFCCISVNSGQNRISTVDFIFDFICRDSYQTALFFCLGKCIPVKSNGVVFISKQQKIVCFVIITFFIEIFELKGDKIVLFALNFNCKFFFIKSNSDLGSIDCCGSLDTIFPLILKQDVGNMPLIVKCNQAVYPIFR